MSELVFKLGPGAKEKLLADDVVNRQGLVFRDGASLGVKKGSYVYIYGDDAAIRRAHDLLKDIAEEITGKEKQKVIEKIKSEESEAQEGFGSIFG